MHRTIFCTLLAAAISFQTAPSLALTVPSGSTGSSQSFDNIQPSLAINYFIPSQGTFPSRSGGNSPQMLLGSVRMTASPLNHAAPTDGQLLPISQFQALFSLLGTTYGGDGRTTFALPDLRGQTAIGEGSGPLGNSRFGQNIGNENATLTESQLPAHTHSVPIILEPSTLAFVTVSLLAILPTRRKHTR